MSSSPERRSGRIIRAAHSVGLDVEEVEIGSVEELPMGSDGRPISAELHAAREKAYRKGLDRGYSEGFQAGAKDGRERAVRSTREELATAVVAFGAALDQLRAVDQVRLEHLEQHVLALAYGVAEAIVGRELALAESPARDALARALALVPERGDVLVRVHPIDADSLRSHAALPGREVLVVDDPDIERGGCVLQVGACRIDAQVGPALARVRSVLLGANAPDDEVAVLVGEAC